MKTLYLRNVPDEVAHNLDRLASAEGMSLSAFAVKELTESARRADNRRLLDALPDLQVPISAIVADLDEARRER